MCFSWAKFVERPWHLDLTGKGYALSRLFMDVSFRVDLAVVCFRSQVMENQHQNEYA
jgi:hypothetical protein